MSVGESKLEEPAGFTTMSRLGILEKGGHQRLRSFGEFFSTYYGGDDINRQAVGFEFEVTKLSTALYEPSILQVHNSADYELIKSGNYIKQLKTETGFAQVDPLTGANQEGFKIRVWKNLHTTLIKNGTFYEEPTEEPLSEVVFMKPPNGTAGQELLIYFTEKFGAGSAHRYVEHHVENYGSGQTKPSSLVTTTYTAATPHDLTSSLLPANIIKKETITYSARGAREWDYTLHRTVEEAPVDADGNMDATNLKIVSSTKEVYQDFSLSPAGGEFGGRRMVEMYRDPADTNLLTKYEYYNNTANPIVHGRLKSIERPDGTWEYHEVNDSGSGGSATEIVYLPYLDKTMAERAQAIRQINLYEANKHTLTTYIGTQQISEQITEFSKAGNGDITLTQTRNAGSENSTTITVYHSHTGTGVQAGRKKSQIHSDGTITLWSYLNNFPNLEITLETGGGTLSGITDGIKTVTTYNAANQIIIEKIYDIASIQLISSRDSVGLGAIDPQGRPTTWKYHDNPSDTSVMQYGCCGPESTTDRSGATQLFFRDGLRRVYKIISKRSTGGSNETTPTVTTTTTYDGLTTETRRLAGTFDLLVNKTTRFLSGLRTEAISPDADGDPNTIEETIREMVYNSTTGPTTTTTYPDDTTIVTTTFRDGQVKLVTDQAGDATTYNYGLSESPRPLGWRTQTVTQPGNTQWTKTYTDQLGRTTLVEYPDGAEMTYAYNSYTATSQNPQGSLGKLASTTDPDNVTISYEYNSEGDRTTTIRPIAGGLTQTTITDSDVLATKIVGSVTMTPAIHSWIKINGITTSESYRSRDGRIDATVSFDRETISVTTIPDDGEWTTTTTAPTGARSRAFYKDGLMKTAVSFESGSTLPTSAPADITTYSASGFITGNSATHDAYDRIETQSNARTGTTTMGAYLENGSLTSITAPGDVNGSRTTSFTYDIMGRRIEVDAPDTGGYDNKAYTSYTDRSQVKATWGDQTYPRFYEYDAQGRMVKLYTYKNELPTDPQTGEPLEPTIASAAASTEWKYHSQRGWLTEKNYAGETGNGPGPQGGSSTADYDYTLAGRLATRTWERGVTTTYGYDQGLLTSVDYSDATKDLAYIYDAFGRLDKVYRGTDLTVLDPAELHASYEYSQNELLLTQEYLNRDTAASRYLTRNYQDGTGNNSVNLRPSGLTVSAASNASNPEHSTTYTYDTAGRLGTVANLAGDTFTYRYMSEDTPGAGNLIHSLTTAPFGAASNFELKTSNTYEVSRNVLLTKENKAGTTNISTYTYGVNDIGQRISLSTSGDAFGAAAPSLTWGYNARGELTSAANATTGTHNRGYNYDVIGNRIESVTGTTTLTGTSNYTSNALNQYTQVPAPSAPLQPDYDLDGNATSYPLPESPDAKATLTWDAENRLIKVLRPAQGGQPAMEIDYDYDYLSRRITKTTGGTSTHYLYDSWNCVAEYTLTSSVLNLTSSYTWGLDLSGSMQGAGGVGGLLAVTHESVAGDPTYYPTYDGNGNVSEYLNDAGTNIAHFEYDPFGNVTATGGTSPQDFDIRFSTKKRDSETGLYYYGYRYYDPVTGRWPSRDPLDEFGHKLIISAFSISQSDGIGGDNLYGFIFNSPINLIDADGRAVPAVIGGIAAASIAKTVAASFGVSLFCCMLMPECRDAVADALRKAVCVAGCEAAHAAAEIACLRFGGLKNVQCRNRAADELADCLLGCN